MKTIHQISFFFQDIKIAHSVFALPFALSGLLFTPVQSVSFSQYIFLFLCMFFARTAAMGYNRYHDCELDLKNSRTKSRMIPMGHLSKKYALFFTLLSAALLVISSFYLNRLSGFLSPILILYLFLYSHLKFYTYWCHLYLGTCLGLVPIAVSIAIHESVTLPTILLGLAVTFWTTGFDCLYSLFDISFDKKEGLYSIPSRFGRPLTFLIAAGLFLSMIMCLILAGLMVKAQIIYRIGVFVVASLLVFEMYLVKDALFDHHPRYLNQAFFTVNGVSGVLFYLFALVDYHIFSWSF